VGKKRKKRGEPAPPPPTGPAPIDIDAGVRLLGLRDQLMAGAIDDAIGTVDAWLAELGVPLDASEPVDRPFISVLMAS